jgi:hypothetical protein
VSTPDATATTSTDGDKLNVDWNAGADDSPLERPEVQAGVAFAGGVVLAFVLKRLRGV